MKYNHFQVLGEYYGYPQCCIDAFIKRCDTIDASKRSPLSKYQNQVHKNKGFIPCPACAKRVAVGEITIEQLIQNRKAPKPYPKCSSLRTVDRYLQSFKS